MPPTMGRDLYLLLFSFKTHTNTHITFTKDTVVYLLSYFHLHALSCSLNCGTDFPYLSSPCALKFILFSCFVLLEMPYTFHFLPVHDSQYAQHYKPLLKYSRIGKMHIYPVYNFLQYLLLHTKMKH